MLVPSIAIQIGQYKRPGIAKAPTVGRSIACNIGVSRQHFTQNLCSFATFYCDAALALIELKSG